MLKMLRIGSLLAGAMLLAGSANAAPITFDILFNELLDTSVLEGSVTFDDAAIGGATAASAISWEISETLVATGERIGHWTGADPLYLYEAVNLAGGFSINAILADYVDAAYAGYWIGLVRGVFLSPTNIGTFRLQTAAGTPASTDQPAIPEPSAALVFPLGIGAAWLARRRSARA